MLESLLVGGGFGFAAMVQPGPMQAFLVSRVAVIGWRRTLPACIAPLISDVPIALLVLLVLGPLSPTAQDALRAAGGGLLLFLAWGSVRQWRRRGAAPELPGSAPRTLFAAVMVNALNPNPYLGWALVLGPSVLDAWHEHPANAAALVAAFYGTMVGMNALFVAMVGTTRVLGSRVQRVLVAGAAAGLAGLGIFLIVTGVQHLGAR